MSPQPNSDNSPSASSNVQTKRAQSTEQQPHGPPKTGPSGREPAIGSPPKPKSPQPQQKKLAGRSSKPIINWLQRKLAGSAKHPRRAPSVAATEAKPRAENGTVKGHKRVASGSQTSPRIPSSSYPQPTLLTPTKHGKGDSGSSAAAQKSISLNADDDGQNRSYVSYEGDDQSENRSSLARELAWSPISNTEADEDASVRPLPPSGPPSPSPSLSASSYMSDPHTFRSMAASTKPTTLLSIDLPPDGVAHIAQAPPTPIMAAAGTRFLPHIRTNSAGTSVIGSGGASITFSSLPPQTSSRQSSLNTGANMDPQSVLASINGQATQIQAPLHTAHHPRNNPRPSSPPQDNASMLTLASSAYGARLPFTLPGWAPGTPSAMADSRSQFGFNGSINGDGDSQYAPGDDDRLEVYGERDVDASVRALRPRSSRRGSWESDASDWSGPVGSQGAARSTGTPSRSLWTTNSVRTGARASIDDAEPTDKSEEDGASANEQSLEQSTPSKPTEPLPHDGEDAPPLPIRQQSNGSQATPKSDGLTPDLHQPVKPASSAHDGKAADAWHSAPTSPLT
ncbi:hypothetical protein FIBSPDRAFT_1042095 [Athelia psychrophila]|uniref:Uncharacterized protein n=1 Tax=Athelia psychrophila TaxID=1759441 RepID=A0A166N4X4_9AGAM|nr:hypothetical protein FIBSPDRAFT_1042095 [Fibularhizoctonia sp. CBS 109695]